jgi:cobalt/nickel transport system ATP-binding protein
MSDFIYQLDRVSFGFIPDQPVLRDLSFAIAPGDRIALTGNNGAGKTTLLHMLVGLIKPQSGTLFAFGAKRMVERDFHEVRLRAGLVFEDTDDQLFCATVAEDVAFGPFNMGWSRARVKAAVSSTLERVGLGGYEHRITEQLSHGEKRLVSLASVLAMEPELLLLDEPTDGLDGVHRQRVMDVLKGTAAAMVIASHDRVFLDALCRTLWRLEGGVLVAS